MSERTQHKEHQVHHEHVVSHEHVAQAERQQAAAAEAARAHQGHENLAHIRELTEKHAQKSEHLRPAEQPDSEADRLFGMQHELKQAAYTRTLAQVRRKLPRRVRSFSKLAHNATVDAVSGVSAQTIARPSGLLGGSVCAFLGTSLLWYYSKHYGFRYNYTVMLVFFIGGFAAGLMFELLIWVFYNRRTR